jgi:hypothetical protein
MTSGARRKTPRRRKVDPKQQLREARHTPSCPPLRRPNRRRHLTRPTQQRSIGIRGSRFMWFDRASIRCQPTRLAQTKWGPALLPAPNAPSEGSAGVQSTWPRPREGLRPRFSILAHQLRRRFPSCSSLLRRARLFYSTTLARKLRLPFVRPGLALEPRSENRTSVQNHPMFRGPSWDDLCHVPLCH